MNEPFLKPLVRVTPETDWALIFIGLTLILFVISKLLFPRYHTRIARAFFNRYEATKLIEEKNVLIGRNGLILNLIPLLCLAMLVFQQRGYLHPGLLFEKPALIYLWILAVITAYFGIRVVLVAFFGYAIEQKEIAMRFNQLWFLQFENLGTFLLIPALILPYTANPIKKLVLAGLWIVVIAWALYTIYRELDLLRSNRVSIFYMFLYLCTLEILPIWWAVKSLTGGW